MGFIIEGIIRPNNFEECITCPEASRNIIKASSRGAENIRVGCRDNRLKLGPFRIGRPAIIMTVLAPLSKPTERGNRFFETLDNSNQSTSIEQFHYSKSNVTDKCRGLKKR